MESRRRSIVKSLSWRFFALIITAVLGGMITGSVRMGLAIGGADLVVKLGTYYVHERLWQRVRWGLLAPETTGPGSGI